MPYKDLHEKPFNEPTLAKLDIFEAYAQAWLPTFVMQNGVDTVCIFDFFAGTGYDKNNKAGSPIRILQVVKQYAIQIFQKKVTIKIYFNEYKKEKYDLLIEACNKFFDEKENSIVRRAVNIEFSNESFEICFDRLYPEIEKHPSLVYLDQNGIKFLSEKYFLALEKTNRTDFLYFISSSYFWRFGEKDEFKMHLDLDMDLAKKNPYNFIHRSLIQQISQKLPDDSKLTLYPFSLKKGANIHGIIFGAKHPRAVEKFLDTVWKMNPVNGEANFDIDEDSKKAQLNMFESKRLTKIESFQNKLNEKIKSDGIITNAEVYLFTLANGHPRSHATAIIKDLKKKGLVTYKSTSPKINFTALKKEEAIVEIKWVKK